MIFFATIKKYEPVVFFVVIFVNLMPVFSSSTPYSADGSAHSYNTALLHHFLSGTTNQINDFLQVNPVPVPNYSGHFLMALFQLFVTPVLSEKLLLVFILVFIPFSFRYLVRSFKNHNIIAAYFIFAISYSCFHLLGFYNFLLSLVPFFYLFGYYIRYMNRLKFQQYLTMALLLLAVYFSHAFVYLFSVLIITLLMVLHILSDRAFAWPYRFRTLSRRSLLFVLCVLPSGILFYCFYLTRPEHFVMDYKPVEVVWEHFMKNSSFISFVNAEERYTRPLLWTFVSLFFVALVFRLVQWAKTRTVEVTDFFLVVLVLLFVLLFVLPDNDGWGGFYMVRTLLLINVFMLLWAASVCIPVWTRLAATGTMFFYHILLINGYSNEYIAQQPVLKTCTKAGHLVEPGALVLPINISGNWVLTHTGSRVGEVNRALVLENYEAGTNYFPLTWKREGIPEPVFSSGKVPDAFVTWPRNYNGRKVLIDYIFVIGDPYVQESVPWQKLRKVITTEYVPLLGENNCHLFKRKG